MPRTENVNIHSQQPLTPPAELKSRLPLSQSGIDLVYSGRRATREILDGIDERLLVIVGPCSIHNPDEALEFAEKLTRLSSQVKDRLLLVMRVYFEKPRTTIGWKGLIYDPELNGSYNIEKGVFIARELLIKIVEMGLPAATEILDPVITQYIADTITWAAIGARTTESQPHRQLVSGLSMPTGFKNGTDGGIKVAVDAVKAANSEHAFIGVTADGRAGIFRTKGNKHAHVVLRGGTSGPNYYSENIAFAKELMRKNGLRPNLVVDCSHANSGKQAERQLDVADNVIKQILSGEDAIIGVMIESNLTTGNQTLDEKITPRRGVSVTDPCLGWKDTQALILGIHEALENESHNNRRVNRTTR